jgi:hypothetical protein
MVHPKAPMTNWPSTPILKIPAFFAIPTAKAQKHIGTDFEIVFIKLAEEPKAPLINKLNTSKGLYPADSNRMNNSSTVVEIIKTREALSNIPSFQI